MSLQNSTSTYDGGHFDHLVYFTPRGTFRTKKDDSTAKNLGRRARWHPSTDRLVNLGMFTAPSVTSGKDKQGASGEIKRKWNTLTLCHK
ncbi:hypothetical protein EYF80_013455 [Liparis tanakae]|uniref:Uncharacterized protein n=1 Tax=Liparis tanakae TaxID=230148 RepID=A0A4Z2IEM3_9TELE|nr:hypothetical protein EYF80_013455 [Liparis tanakae]